MSKITTQAWEAAGYPLTMESEIIKLRDEIRNNHQHKGANRVMLKAAYNEMRKRQGKGIKTMDCGRCLTDINNQMKIWLRIYDTRTDAQTTKARNMIKVLSGGTDAPAAIDGVDSSDQLVPVNQRRAELESMDYWDLKAIIKDLSQESQDRLKAKAKNGANKKPDIIEEILKR